MAKYIYPAVFGRNGALYTVRFPDLECCYTQGDSLQDAYEMASDVLCLTLYGLEEKGAEIPPVSSVAEVKTSEGEFASLVACDTLEYRKYYDNKAVKKTLTIPSWLNTMSEREGINFSAVLQSALKSELHITDR
ncbi:MAG: type II toxin-antitoxin system HicB family antitoxin [Oscillospiraceae bacterium]|nr:type II toxin-antitoxin system HicB family antitoxin [Oscillospiraceae bacterium]